jgi:hypothetical protein
MLAVFICGLPPAASGRIMHALERTLAGLPLTPRERAWWGRWPRRAILGTISAWVAGCAMVWLAGPQATRPGAALYALAVLFDRVLSAGWLLVAAALAVLAALSYDRARSAGGLDLLRLTRVGGRTYAAVALVRVMMRFPVWLPLLPATAFVESLLWIMGSYGALALIGTTLMLIGDVALVVASVLLGIYSAMHASTPAGSAGTAIAAQAITQLVVPGCCLLFQLGPGSFARLMAVLLWCTYEVLLCLMVRDTAGRRLSSPLADDPAGLDLTANPDHSVHAVTAALDLADNPDPALPVVPAPGDAGDWR